MISFYSTKDSHSLPRGVIHSEGPLSGPRSFLPSGVFGSRVHLCSCRLSEAKARTGLQRALVCVFK